MFHQFFIYTSVFCAIAVVGLGFLCIIIILINDAKYEEVYRLYQEKFGSNMSPMVRADRYSGSYNVLSKISTFGSVLLLKKDSWFIRNLPQSHYDYIRSLPKSLTRWMAITTFLTYCLWGFTVASVISVYFMHYFMLHLKIVSDYITSFFS